MSHKLGKRSPAWAISLAFLFPWLLLLVALTCGCGTMRKVDRSLFTSTTNSIVVENVVTETRTNQVVSAQEVISAWTLETGETKFATNWSTNIVPVVVTLIHTNKTTNQVVQVKPSATAETVTATASAIGSLFGVGAVVSTALSGLWAAIASYRNARSKRVAVALIEGAEVARQLLLHATQDRELYDKTGRALAMTQQSIGVQSDVAKLMDKYLDPDSAKEFALALSNANENRV